MIGLRLFRTPNGTIGWILVQTAWMCCAGFAVAQVSEITDPAQLSEHAVSLEFGGDACEWTLHWPVRRPQRSSRDGELRFAVPLRPPR